MEEGVRPRLLSSSSVLSGSGKSRSLAPLSVRDVNNDIHGEGKSSGGREKKLINQGREVDDGNSPIHALNPPKTCLLSFFTKDQTRDNLENTFLVQNLF